MNNSYKIDFESLRQDGLKELFQIIEPIFEEFKIDYYMIGAIARDVWYVKKGISSGATKDVDIALFIAEEKQYQNVKNLLTEEFGFKESKENAYALHTPFGYPIDLLPFGEIEIDDAIQLEGEGLTFIHVNGFKEVYEQGIKELDIDDDLSFKVATLPSLVLLKMIAYDDRPERRSKDIQDIANILGHYFDIESELIYDNHADLFEKDAESYELEDVSARVIGRELRSILNKNEELKKRFLTILELNEKKHQRIPELMAAGSKFSIDRSTELLQEIAEGVKE